MKKFSFSALVFGATLLQGCLFSTESGSPYQAPSESTSSQFSYSSLVLQGSIIEDAANVTFRENSAKVSVQLGSKTYSIVPREIVLRPWWSGDSEWKSSTYRDVIRSNIETDSRGIASIRRGEYSVYGSGNQYLDANFFYFARDSKGNVFGNDLISSERGAPETRRSQSPMPFLTWPASAQVGDSWVTRYHPFLVDQDAAGGYRVVLVDDNATSPVTGVPGCIVLFVQNKNWAYYYYLTPESDIVEVINNWTTNSQGRIVPIGASIARTALETPLPGAMHIGFGYGDRVAVVSEPVVAVGALKGTDPDYAGLRTPPLGLNSTGFDFVFAFNSLSKSNNFCNEIPASETRNVICDLSLPIALNTSNVIDFADPRFNVMVADPYRPRLRVSVIDDAGLRKVFTVKDRQMKILPTEETITSTKTTIVRMQGKVVDEANPADVRDFTGTVSLLNLATLSSTGSSQSAFIPKIILFEADSQGVLPSFRAGSEQYLNWGLIGSPEQNTTTTRVYISNSPSMTGKMRADSPGTDFRVTCYRATSSLPCESNHRFLKLRVPSVGDQYLQIETDYIPPGTATTKTVTSPIYSFKSVSAGGSSPPRARISHFSTDRDVGVARDTGTGVVRIKFDGKRSSDSDGTIKSFAWEVAKDGQVISGVGSNTPSAPELTYDFNEDGKYSVALTVTDSDGNTSRDSVKVAVSNEATLTITNQRTRDFARGQDWTLANVWLDDLATPDTVDHYYESIWLQFGHVQRIPIPKPGTWQIIVQIDATPEDYGSDPPSSWPVYSDQTYTVTPGKTYPIVVLDN